MITFKKWNEVIDGFLVKVQLFLLRLLHFSIGV